MGGVDNTIASSRLALSTGGGMERPTSSGSVSVSFLCSHAPDTFIPFGIFFALVPSDAVISI
jgi:hypothetical protein